MSDFNALEGRIAELERELGSLRDEIGEVKTDMGSMKSDVVSLKSEIASARVDIERVSRRVLEATLENRRSDKVVIGKLDDMRAAVSGLLEHLQPKVIVSPHLSPPPPQGKDS